MATYKIINDDCIHAMKMMEPNSIDSIVTDPPYGISFCSKEWDHGVPGIPFWTEALRVLKPGGHILAFGGTRTHHRLMTSIEDSGFEIRDVIMWVYASGFPKSHNISKSIDKIMGCEREVIGNTNQHDIRGGCTINSKKTIIDHPITTSSSSQAKQWDGWGSALKPSWEPIIVCRKPLDNNHTIAKNVLKYGTGGINIDGCRVPTDDNVFRDFSKQKSTGSDMIGQIPKKEEGIWHMPSEGRFPANLIHDGSDEVTNLFPITAKSVKRNNDGKHIYQGILNHSTSKSISDRGYEDNGGSASRFFYCAKPSSSERDIGGIENIHPTVKPRKLMAYLCKLITPPNGTILDPFTGSGSTGIGAIMEGFNFVGIEQSPEYCIIANKRISHFHINKHEEKDDDILEEMLKDWK